MPTRTRSPIRTRCRSLIETDSARPIAARLLATIRSGDVRLWSRNQLEWTDRVPEVRDALVALGLQEAVLDVSRYEVFGLSTAMLTGDRKRVLKVIAGLRAEDEPLPLILWVVGEDVRTLLQLRAALDGGMPFAQATRKVWVRRDKEEAIQAALRRLDTTRLARLLARCAELDRISKGLTVAQRDSDPWLELSEIALGVAA